MLNLNSTPSKYLVTVDRDCRQLFAVDRARGTCEPLVELEQRLDHGLDVRLTEDARKWNRGLKTISPIPGGYIVCDIFGIYRLDWNFAITQYLSIPKFIDIHSAFPAGDCLIVSNTGVDQVLWVDWAGNILDSIDLHRWFPATPWMAHDVGLIREREGGDLRLMPLDWARESCHVNWAEETPLGTMVSCFIQGEIFFFKGGRPIRTVPACSKCHAPRLLAETGTILFSASEENRIVEVDMEGRVLWEMEGFQFPKFADLLPDGRLIVADTGNQRIVEVDRREKKITWECAIPGTPYFIEPWNRGEGAR